MIRTLARFALALSVTACSRFDTVTCDAWYPDDRAAGASVTRSEVPHGDDTTVRWQAMKALCARTQRPAVCGPSSEPSVEIFLAAQKSGALAFDCHVVKEQTVPWGAH